MWDRWYRTWLDAITWWLPRSDNAKAEHQTAEEPHRDPEEQLVADAPATARQPEAPQATASESSAADDLTVIKGVGPAMQRRLEALGIVTFADLAKADAQALADKLKSTQPMLTKDKVEGWIEAARAYRHGA